MWYKSNLTTCKLYIANHYYSFYPFIFDDTLHVYPPHRIFNNSLIYSTYQGHQRYFDENTNE